MHSIRLGCIEQLHEAIAMNTFSILWRMLLSLLALSTPIASTLAAETTVWTCSRAEPEQTVFEGIKPFRIENLSVKDDSTIAITLLDLYAAYGGELIQMGKQKLSACALPAHDPLQISAVSQLGYSPEDLIKASKRSLSPLVFIPSISEMQKCLNENHPAVGFLQNVVENERIGPCF